MRLIDRTNQALGHDIARTRQESAIRRIGIHHSATATGTTAIFENFWRTIPNVMAGVGGYHEVILLNGDVEINYPPTRVSHGVSGQNGDTYNICVVGNFVQSAPSGVQLQVLLDRIRFNVNRFANVTFDRVLGHREFPGQSTTCPGPATNMNNIRAQASQQVDMHTITRATGGFYTAADALAGRNQRTTIQPGTYHVYNRSQGMINVTTRVGTPGSWINPTATGQPDNTIRVGSRVRVNQNASRWATGETIPSWVRGQTYTVSQIRNNNNELLLASVMSWIRRSDVTLV